VDVHQRLGMAGTDLLRRDGGAFEVNAKAFYAGTLGDMVVFGTLLFAATITPARATHGRLPPSVAISEFVQLSVNCSLRFSRCNLFPG